MPIVDSALTKEEKDLQECTFRPKINKSCPFVSDRTLRRYAQLNRRPPPPPPSPSVDNSDVEPNTPVGSNKKSMFAGNFTRAQGFVRGPPQSAGVTLFYFDPLNPPEFIASGPTRQESDEEEGDDDSQEDSSSSEEDEEEMEEVEVEEEEEVLAEEPAQKTSTTGVSKANTTESKLVAPPLPPFASGVAGTGGSTAGAPPPAPRPKIVIEKKAKEEKKVEEPTGWQAIMAEMQRRANGGALKAVETKKAPEPPPPPAASKQKKGKKPKFKDVMDELNYKLAVLRGEVEVESDSEEESGTSGALSPATPAAAVAKKADPPAAAAPELRRPSTEPKEASPATSQSAKKNLSAADKLKSMLAAKANPNTTAAPKPDLNAMLAKVNKVETGGTTPAGSVAPVDSSEALAAAAKATDGASLNSADNKAKAAAALSGLFKPKVAPPVEGVATSNENKTNAAAALNKLFASKLSPPMAPPAIPTSAPVAPSVTAAPTNNTAVTVSAPKGQPGNDIAKERPKKVPRAPPLPAKWPPEPFISTAPFSVESSDSEPETPAPADTGKPAVGVKKLVKRLVPKRKVTAKDKPTEAGSADKSSKKSSKSKSKSKRSPVGLNQVLSRYEEGYYIAAPQRELVEQQSLLKAGTLNEDMFKRLVLQFDRSLEQRQSSRSVPSSPSSNPEYATAFYEQRSEMINEMRDKLSINDLPVPSSFISSVQRMQKATQLRRERQDIERALDLRNYDVEAGHFNGNTHGGSNADMSSTVRSMSSSVSSHAPFAFATDKRFAEKAYTFRKTKMQSHNENIATMLSDVEMDWQRTVELEREISRGSAMLINAYHSNQAQMGRESACWMNSLRSSSASALSPSSLMQSSPSKSASATRTATLRASARPLSPERRLQTITQSMETALTVDDLSHSYSQAIFSATLTSQQCNVNISQQSLQSAHRIVDTAVKQQHSLSFQGRPRPRTPPLLTDQVIERRKDYQCIKQSNEEQAMEEAKRREKQRREKLRLAAQHTALTTGTYVPHQRRRYHQQLAAKYSNNVEVVGGFDIMSKTNQAFQEYRHGPRFAGEPLAQSELWTNENQGMADYDPAEHRNQSFLNYDSHSESSSSLQAPQTSPYRTFRVSSSSQPNATANGSQQALRRPMTAVPESVYSRNAPPFTPADWQQAQPQQYQSSKVAQPALASLSPPQNWPTDEDELLSLYDEGTLTSRTGGSPRLRRLDQ